MNNNKTVNSSFLLFALVGLPIKWMFYLIYLFFMLIFKLIIPQENRVCISADKPNRLDSHRIRDLLTLPNEFNSEKNGSNQFPKNNIMISQNKENKVDIINKFNKNHRKSGSERQLFMQRNITGRFSINLFNDNFRRKMSSAKNILNEQELDGKIEQSQTLSLLEMGANSFMNSAFLAISFCPKFVKDMRELRLKYETGLEKLSIFNELLTIVSGGTTSRKRISSNRVYKQWNKLCQEDSFEILEHVLHQVYNEIRKYIIETGDDSVNFIQEWLKVNLPLRLLLEYRIFCKCGSELQVFLQSDFALHVHIPSNDDKNVNVQMLIDQFFSNDRIEEFDCVESGCTEHEAIRYTRLREPLPSTLCVHLQRICWNGLQMEKLQTKLNFSSNLTIKSEFFVKDIEEKNSHEKGSRTRKINMIQTDHHFQLRSVLVYQDSIYGGQYDCYKYEDGNWQLVNEKGVTKVDDIEVFECEAQVLFYEDIDTNSS